MSEINSLLEAYRDYRYTRNPHEFLGRLDGLIKEHHPSAPIVLPQLPDNDQDLDSLLDEVKRHIVTKFEIPEDRVEVLTDYCSGWEVNIADRIVNTDHGNEIIYRTLNFNKRKDIARYIYNIAQHRLPNFYFAFRPGHNEVLWSGEIGKFIASPRRFEVYHKTPIVTGKEAPIGEGVIFSDNSVAVSWLNSSTPSVLFESINIVRETYRVLRLW